MLLRVLAGAAAVAVGVAGGAGVAASGGCTPAVVITAGMAAAQAGTSAYISGELLSARQATLEESWWATLAALDELAFDVQFVRPPDDPDSLGPGGMPISAYVMAQDPAGPRVRIRLSRASDAVTRMRVRIDTLGDQALSRLVISRIDARLPAPPPVEPVPWPGY